MLVVFTLKNYDKKHYTAIAFLTLVIYYFRVNGWSKCTAVFGARYFGGAV